MAEEIHSPLLALVKEQGLIDDLQFEDVAGEFKRSGKPVIQVLQDFGIMDLDSILQVIANHLATEVVTVNEKSISPDALQAVPAKTARMYQCLPIRLDGGNLQLALMDPLNTPRVDELGFLLKKDIQVVVADPAAIEKCIEKLYSEGNDSGESVADILKELGMDKELAAEAAKVHAPSEVDDESLMADLANQAPIVRFVNLVLFQAIQDRAATFTSSRSKRSSRSATGWTARSTRWRRRPSTWPCRSSRASRSWPT